MKLLVSVVLALAPTGFGQTPSSSNPIVELEALKTRYAAALEPIAKDREAKLAALKEAQLARLDTLQKQTTVKGDLETALQVKAERERLGAGTETTDAEAKVMRPSLVSLRASYQKEVAALLSAFRSREQTPAKQHVGALDSLLKRVTAAGDLDTAVLVKEERDRVGGTTPAAAIPQRGAARLTIISAEYGSPDRKRVEDVTAGLRKVYAAGTHSVELDGPKIGASGDPAPGVIKQITVVYSSNGKRAQKTFRQGHHLNFETDLK